MTTQEARRLILPSLLLMAGITYVREVKKGTLPEPRTVVGAFGAAMLLNTLAGPAPDVAAGLAMIALITHAITERGTIGTIADVFAPNGR